MAGDVYRNGHFFTYSWDERCPYQIWFPEYDGRSHSGTTCEDPLLELDDCDLEGVTIYYQGEIILVGEEGHRLALDAETGKYTQVPIN
jgi:hypothetical protein